MIPTSVKQVRPWRALGRLMRRLTPAVMVVAIAMAPGSGAAYAKERTATAPISVNLGRIGFGSVVVDGTNQHVFVAAPLTNEVIVLGYKGNIVKRIENEYGAAGMVVTRGYVYVAQRDAGAIDKISLTSLSSVGTVAQGLNWPYILVATDGKLWVTVGDRASSTLVSVDPVTKVVTQFSTAYFAPYLATSLDDPTTIFLAESIDPGRLYRLSVSSGRPVVVAQNLFTSEWNIGGLAVSPDGTRVIPVSGAPYWFEEYSSSTLQPDGTIYPANPYPTAVAVSPVDGGLLAGGLDGGYTSPDIFVFPIGSPVPILTFTTKDSNGAANVLPQGLVFTACGERLIAMTASDTYGTDTIFNSFPLPSI